MLLNIELKQLYTVITRAKVNLWIYESQPFSIHELPILGEWSESGSGLPLVDTIDPGDPSFKFSESFATVEKSTPKQWKLQGDTLLRHKKWKQASLCYRKAERFDLEAETDAKALEAKALETKASHTVSYYSEVAVAYLKVNKITRNPTYLTRVAENLHFAAKTPDEFLRVSWLYQKLKLVSLYINMIV